MIKSLELDQFLELPGTIFDVRSPSEHTQGRIPNSVSLPIFNDEERAAVGTAYKQESREKAIDLGLEFVGPKLKDYIRLAKGHLDVGCAKIHCWRGGMRSSSMAWLFNNAGIESVTLNGGYKTFRKWALETFEKPYEFKVLGGFTGCGKTEILQALHDLAEQALDLEGLANHRGSSFGNLGMPPQPSTEQFQNEIAYQLSTFDADKPIWVEDESTMIGFCRIPEGIFSQMREAKLTIIERPIDERLEILQQNYSSGHPQEWIKATQKISKKLGGARTQEVIDNIKSGHLENAAKLVLQYYDKTYEHSLSRGESERIIRRFQAKGKSSQDIAARLSV